MIKIETSKGKNTKKLIKKYEKPFPLTQITKTIQEDIIQETKKRGWRRIAGTIKIKKLGVDSQEVYIGGKKKDAEIAEFLNTGTKGHFIKPKRKKALSWTAGGNRFFSKGHYVRGIKATKFFRLYTTTKAKINAIIKKHYK